MALMVWPPSDRLLVGALVAAPLLRLTGLPKFVLSITNWTVPLGVPLPGPLAAIITVNVTFWPSTDGFAEEVSTVLVVALPTVCVTAVEVLVARLPSPL